VCEERKRRNFDDPYVTTAIMSATNKPLSDMHTILHHELTARHRKENLAQRLLLLQFSSCDRAGWSVILCTRLSF